MGPNTLWAARPDLEAEIFILGYKLPILSVESACFVAKIIYWGGVQNPFFGAKIAILGLNTPEGRDAALLRQKNHIFRLKNTAWRRRER